MQASRYLLLLAAFALVVGFASANDSETPEPLAMTDLTQSLVVESPVVEAPVCSLTSVQAGVPFPPPDLCAECLAACHPADFVCRLACLNGPCI